MNDVLVANGLSKEYPLPDDTLCVFENLEFSLAKGELIAIMGVSGVGKTTLLNLFGALDRPNKGKVFIEGEDVFSKNEDELAEIRNRHIGFIFQFYHLLPEFTAVENVSFPLLIRGVDRKEAFAKAIDKLDEVSLTDKAALRPVQLSGGEQQRIAIARALVNDPKILLADEPTGNLDWKTGLKILKLIENLHRSKGLSSILVTHNEKVARFCQKAYLMENGILKLLPSP
ncbi:MAG: ATP-binding cassette domain-containing protein [Candidatus Aminicenantes bacterium]|jgi:lipoprotein-releasing system ATP-binding protein|nr:ATP-binding cassette domain-containing protein [Candidatus Aminicenantes bacterium]